MDRYLVISSDGHAGPRPEVYRDYLDPQHRDELIDLLIGRIFDDRPRRLFHDLEPWLERRAASDE